jgi:hypothetical protein
MLKRLISVVVIGLIFLVGFYAGRARPTSVYAQAPRVGTIPKEWGTFKGTYLAWGAFFEDSNGTIRIVEIRKFIDGEGMPQLVGTLTRK